MAAQTFTYDEAQEIAKHPELYSKKDVEEAQKFIDSNKSASVDMSIEEAREIKAHPELYGTKDLAMAKTVIAQHRPAPGKWIGKYMPINKEGGFNFNWRQAYNKPVKNDEDVEKLADWMNTQVWDVDDDIDLRDVATEMGFKHRDEGWEDFIKSERFPIFQAYLEDVRNTQTQKMVDKVWSGEEPSPQWTPFGYKEVPLSKQVTDFMLPVSKEYAQKHYNDKDFSLAGPIATDAAANFVMAGPGWTTALPAKASAATGKFFSKPLISTIYGNVAAPAITETGNVIYNDESIPEAIARTAEGTAINIGTPRMLENIGSWAGRGLPIGESRTVQKMVDEAANKAAKVQDDIRKGKPYPITIEGQPGPIEFAQYNKDGTKYFSQDVPTSQKDWDSLRDAAKKEAWPSRKYESAKDMPAEAVTFDELAQAKQGLPFLRGKEGKTKLAKDLKTIQDTATEVLQDDLIFRKATALAKEGDLRNLSPTELRQLGFADKESLMNYLIRNIKMKMPSSVSTYLTNAAGRPEFGRRAGPIRNINYLLGTDLFGKDETDKEKQTSKIKAVYGL